MTLYSIAQTSADYRRCHAFAREQGITEASFSYPTVMAQKDGTLVAVGGNKGNRRFLHTILVHSLMAVNPLYTIMRMIQLYETILRAAGVTAYFANISKTDERFIDILVALGFERNREVNSQIWLKRELEV